MNQLVAVRSLLTVIALSLVSTGCTTIAKGGDVSDSSPSGFETASIKEASIARENLTLLAVSNRSRSIPTTISGRVISANTIQVFAEVQGKIEPSDRPFKSGVDFQKGATLIQIDDTEFELTLESQRAAFLNVLTGILPDIKSDYPDSYEQWMRYVDGYEFGTSLAPLPTLNSKEEKFFLTSNQVFSLYFQIKSLEDRLTKYQIDAPFAGTITDAKVDVGSLVAPGQALGTIVNRVNYELEVGIPLRIANSLKTGDEVLFTSNEVGGSWQGRVVRINKIVDPTTQNVPVYFSLRGNGLRPGMYLESEIATATTEEVFLIPSTTLKRDESVLVLEDDLIARKRIQPIDFMRDSIMVKGLNDGDLVILTQFDVPVEGSKVKL